MAKELPEDERCDLCKHFRVSNNRFGVCYHPDEIAEEEHEDGLPWMAVVDWCQRFERSGNA